MGQRHQIYVFITDKDKKKVVGTGIHHQWLYGHTAGLQTVRVMEYHKAAEGENYHPLKEMTYRGIQAATDCLKALYQVIPETGYYTDSVHWLDNEPNGDYVTKCVKDPRFGDNNDGITVFDFTDPKKPTYCMMNIGKPIKGGELHADACDLPSMEPVSVEAYVRAYYPVGGSKYQKENHDAKWFAGNEKQIAPILERAKGFKVMTKARAKQLFPAMYKPTRTERERVLAAAKAGKVA